MYIKGIKKSLFRYILFWESMNIYDLILKIIKLGYDILFIVNLFFMCMNNNKFVLWNDFFVFDVI